MKLLFGMMLVLSFATVTRASEGDSAFSLYAGQMTSNHFEELLGGQFDERDSYLLAATLAQRLGGYRDLLSYEVEGQLVRHFKLQDHWEFNLLGVLRWEPFVWDRWLETSAAFGIGPSWATKEPQVEIDNDGETAKFLIYWMMELAIAPFSEKPELELITRIHHRSNAYGLVADDGGSNALAVGFRYRF